MIVYRGHLMAYGWVSLYYNFTVLDFQYEEAFHKATIERDQIAQQYQQYTEQLNSQQTQLQTQVTTLIEERENLVERQAELQSLIQQYESKQQDQSEYSFKIWHILKLFLYSPYGFYPLG